jgi:hypothetical protein
MRDVVDRRSDGSPMFVELAVAAMYRCVAAYR